MLNNSTKRIDEGVVLLKFCKNRIVLVGVVERKHALEDVTGRDRADD